LAQAVVLYISTSFPPQHNTDSGDVQIKSADYELALIDHDIVRVFAKGQMQMPRFSLRK